MHINMGKSKFASVVATGLIMKIYCIYDLKFVETPNVHYDFIPDICTSNMLRKTYHVKKKRRYNIKRILLLQSI